MRKAGVVQDVVVCFDSKANLRNVYTELYTKRRKKNSVFTFGFFAAHGSEKGLHERSGRLLLELQTCRQFDKAVLVLCSCLKTGKFPEKVIELHIEGRRCVRAVIGYEEKMGVVNPSFFNRFDPGYPKAFGEVIECHVSALLAGKSVVETVEAIRKEWYQLLTYRHLSQRSRLVCSYNAGKIRSWGEPKAKIP